ncbi:MAG: hypothetical protein M4D80_20880 [Myxococcota bacterium]|nr:hypothetical protein [Myxococcota bacterium]
MNALLTSEAYRSTGPWRAQARNDTSLLTFQHELHEELVLLEKEAKKPTIVLGSIDRT